MGGCCGLEVKILNAYFKMSTLSRTGLRGTG